MLKCVRIVLEERGEAVRGSWMQSSFEDEGGGESRKEKLKTINVFKN
jgi:hypothetical protein